MVLILVLYSSGYLERIVRKRTIDRRLEFDDDIYRLLQFDRKKKKEKEKRKKEKKDLLSLEMVIVWKEEGKRAKTREGVW